MRVNHLIIAARDVCDPVDFYADVFGFIDHGENPHAEGAQTLVYHSKDAHEIFEVVVQPYDDWLLPNPSHFSIDVDAATFEAIRVRAARRQLTRPAEGDTVSPPPACGELEVSGVIYNSFVVVDPSGTRVEILTRAQAPGMP